MNKTSAYISFIKEYKTLTEKNKDDKIRLNQQVTYLS